MTIKSTNLSNNIVPIFNLTPDPQTKVLSSTNSEFDTLTQNMDPLKKESTAKIISCLENKEKTISKIVELAKCHNFSELSNIFLDPNFEYFALAAVQETELRSIQFGTLMFIRSTLDDKVKIKDLASIPLFNGEAPDTFAWNSIKSTLKLENHIIPSMDDQELAEFFKIMRTLPISEQRFVIIPDTRPSTPPIRNVSQAININATFNVFCSLEVKGEKMRMIPSLGMVKALLDATGTDDFSFKLVIGGSTPNSILLSLLNDNAKEMGIHCKEIAPLPDSADEFDAPPSEFMYHDIYHLWVCRHVPKQQRKFFCEMAQEVNPDNFKDQLTKNMASILYDILLDFDFKHYRPELWGKPIDVEQASFRTLGFRFDEKIKAKMYHHNLYLSQKQLKQAHEILNNFTDKLKRLFAIWKLHKPNYKDFSEITEIYHHLGSKNDQSESALQEIINKIY